MSYIVQSDLESLIPPEWISQALDDNDDGAEDVGLFTNIRDTAEDAVNGVLSLSYSVPIATPANFPFLKHVTRYEAARVCYARRGFKGEEGFPHYDVWKRAWDQLSKIGAGDLPLGPAAGSNEQLARPKGSVITGPAKTYSSSGGNAA